MSAIKNRFHSAIVFTSMLEAIEAEFQVSSEILDTLEALAVTENAEMPLEIAIRATFSSGILSETIARVSESSENPSYISTEDYTIYRDRGAYCLDDIYSNLNTLAKVAILRAVSKSCEDLPDDIHFSTLRHFHSIFDFNDIDNPPTVSDFFRTVREAVNASK